MFRLVSWRPCVSRVSAAPELDRTLKTACVGDRGTERHIGQGGQLEPDMSFSGLRRHASLGLAVGASRYDPHTRHAHDHHPRSLVI